MKSEIISAQNIQLNADVHDWREAIAAAGRLLISSGCTTARYTDEMIEAVDNYGPYIVVAPGLALAHSRPAPSVLKTGLSLVTLAQPVNFGSEENDPVHIILGLCATSNDDHLQIISQLVQFLDHEGNIDLLKTSSDVNQIYFAVNNVE